MKVNDILAVMPSDGRVFFEYREADCFTDVYPIAEIPSKYLELEIDEIFPLTKALCITIAE